MTRPALVALTAGVAACLSLARPAPRETCVVRLEWEAPLVGVGRGRVVQDTTVVDSLDWIPVVPECRWRYDAHERELVVGAHPRADVAEARCLELYRRLIRRAPEPNRAGRT